MDYSGLDEIVEDDEDYSAAVAFPAEESLELPEGFDALEYVEREDESGQLQGYLLFQNIHEDRVAEAYEEMTGESLDLLENDSAATLLTG